MTASTPGKIWLPAQMIAVGGLALASSVAVALSPCARLRDPSADCSFTPVTSAIALSSPANRSRVVHAVASADKRELSVTQPD